jgi:acetolactate synthase-1/2/3 large subunit
VGQSAWRKALKDGFARFVGAASDSTAFDSTNSLICSNRRYGILNLEMLRTGKGEPGSEAQSMMDLSNPALNWVQISKCMGVPAVSAYTAEQLARELTVASNEPGPHLIEMRIVLGR